MSDSDLDRRLARLEPVTPRPGLRDEIVARIREEAARPASARRLPRLDRWLARPAPWAAAAALLLLLAGAALVQGRRHRARRQDLLGPPPAVLSVRERRIRALDAEIAGLLPEGPGREALRWRLRLCLERPVGSPWPFLDVRNGGS